MVVQRKLIITESDRNYIRGLYGVKNTISESEIVITDWLSPDEKYAIFLDELYDITNKVKIGNIWENFDHFKFFLKHSFEVAENISTNIKESVLTSLDSFLITESNQNILGLKPYVKELLSEQNFFTNALDYAKETGKDAVQGVKNFTTTSIEGLKKIHTNIKDGEWKKAFEIVGKGILYVARSIRSALYNPIGIILDAILVASGIGKSAQFVIWAVVVGLDIYELISGNHEDPSLSLPWRLLFLGVDIIGLVFAGIAAKGAKGIVGAAIRKFGSSFGGFTNAMKSNTALQGIAKKILSSLNNAQGLIGKALGSLKTSAPKVYNFISKPLNSFSVFVTKISNLLKGGLKTSYNVASKPGKALKSALGGGKLGSGVQAGLNTGVVVGGIGAYSQGKKNEYESAVTDALSKPGIESEYNYDQL
jgi:hypothetical protein